MSNFVAGERVKIIGFGPKDSWAYAAQLNNPTPLGMTGTIIDVSYISFVDEEYTTCIIHLDEAFMNYLVRMSFYEVKLERIENGKGINPCESNQSE